VTESLEGLQAQQAAEGVGQSVGWGVVCCPVGEAWCDAGVVHGVMLGLYMVCEGAFRQW
jgi:hypothetical protein